MIQDPEDEAFNEIEKQSKMRQEAVRSLNRKRQIENADRVHQGCEAMTQEKTLQALHSENERLGLYKEAYAQRTWVGLTEDDAIELLPAGDWEIESTLEFAKAIEAKLKQNNGYAEEKST